MGPAIEASPGKLNLSFKPLYKFIKGIELSDEIERLKEDIEKSGLPLEADVSSILENNGWNVLNQSGYTDPDTGKARTINILATKRIDTPSSKVFSNLFMELVIECKKSDKPWVFYIKGRGKEFEFPINLVKFHVKPRVRLNLLEVNKLLNPTHYNQPDFQKVAIISYEPFKSEGKQEIFEAKNQVIKALNSELGFMRKFGTYPGTSESISILYPVIVFDGHLFEYEREEEKSKISQTKYLQYLVDYKSPAINDTFLIDIVRKDFIQEYLLSIKIELNAMKNQLEKL